MNRPKGFPGPELSWLVLGACLSLLVGCSSKTPTAGGSEEEQPPTTGSNLQDAGTGPSKVTAYLIPREGTTNFGDKMPELRLSFSRMRNPEITSILQDAAGRLRLVRLRDQQPVEVNIETVLVRDGDPVFALQPKPVHSLPDEWYAFESAGLPAGVWWWNEPFVANLLTDSNGVASVRFRTGSGPIVQSISLCRMGSEARISVNFSEGVSVTQTTIISVANLVPGAGQVRCEPYPITFEFSGSLTTSCAEVDFSSGPVSVAVPNSLPAMQGTGALSATVPFAYGGRVEATLLRFVITPSALPRAEAAPETCGAFYPTRMPWPYEDLKPTPR